MQKYDFSEHKLLNARQQMQSVLKKCPDLTPNGIPVGEPIGSPEDMLEYDLLKQFLICQDWLKQCKVIKTIDKRHTSYGHKHRVENWAGRYICNGAFIAAVIALGIPMQYIHRSPNVFTAISRKSLRFMERQADTSAQNDALNIR
jgi:hypothetical protein